MNTFSTEPTTFTKSFHNYENYMNEFRVHVELTLYKTPFIIKMLNACEKQKQITYERIHHNTLEHILSNQIIPMKRRHIFWNEIKNMIMHLHNINIYHGDFKAKNIMVDETQRLLLCDYDLSKLNCSNEEKKDDRKKMTYMFYQLYLVRENDTHHWPYNNTNKDYRNGEQIYDGGYEFMKDILEFMKTNVMNYNTECFKEYIGY